MCVYDPFLVRLIFLHRAAGHGLDLMRFDNLRQYTRIYTYITYIIVSIRIYLYIYKYINPAN